MFLIVRLTIQNRQNFHFTCAKIEICRSIVIVVIEAADNLRPLTLSDSKITYLFHNMWL